jgi:outer membrane protein OmpA-like peptidoglycan-associated protein
MTSHGQHVEYKKAEKYYNQFEYAAAAEAFEAIASRYPSDVRAWERLAVCYEKLNNSQKAEAWLARLCNRQEAPAHYFKWYAKVLASNGHYTASASWYQKYLDTVPDEHATHTVKGYNNIELFYEDSSFYSIRPLPFNSDQSDFSPSFYEGGLVFCSSRIDVKNKGTYMWDNSAFIDLYWVGNLEAKPIAFGKPINSIMHEGPATFTAGYDTLYFTRNNLTDNRKSIGENDIVKLKIFYSIRKNGIWQKEIGLPLNADNFSVGHPALSPSHRLYFASDMPGGLGGTDLYYTEFVNGHCTAAVNLGPEINTPGNEMFPFIDDQGNLYFASNTHPGLGGLDIFYAKKRENNFQSPKNLGYPINSSKDDFGLIIKAAEGFFSSNRGANHQDDNIYSFTINKSKSVYIQPVSQDGKRLGNFNVLLEGESSEQHHVEQVFSNEFNCEKVYKIQVSKEGYQDQSLTLEREKLISLHQYDTIRIILKDAVKNFQIKLRSDDGKSLAGGTIEIRNLTTGEIQKLITDDNGQTEVVLNTQAQYEFTGSNAAYKSKIVTYNSAELLALYQGTTIEISLLSTNVLFEKNEIGETIELEIRYDVSKSNIRPDAAKELNKLVAFLKKNPTIKVELGSHTDTRGSEEANRKLSQQRAEAAVRYMLSKKISFKQLIPVGYGEHDPKLNNAITEAEHQQNRRTTIKIVGFQD